MRSAASVATHDACNLMGCTNPLLENLRNFVDLSPYRPFGTFIFCTGNGKLVVVKNPDAALQMLFYTAQLSQEEAAEIAQRSLYEHLVYDNELQESLGMQNVVYLDDSLEELPLSSDSGPAIVNTALNDLGLVSFLYLNSCVCKCQLMIYSFGFAEHRSEVMSSSCRGIGEQKVKKPGEDR